MKRLKEIALFTLISLATCLAVFQDSMWGKSIAAPIDIAPALWKHYKHVDPTQGPIPKNHYIVDQLGYDLPLQYVMYHAWRRGEIPWWNPYSLGGRPLLADAHCNGTDPIRLVVYFTVPDFVLAYNWTLILHGIGTGLGVFMLLRGFGVRPWLAGVCALAAQWAGGYVLYIGHPWVRGSFLYYPFLWLAWHRAFRTGRFSAFAVVLIAAILYAGNLQSHAYLPIFALAVGVGCAGFDRAKWWVFLRMAAPSALLGGLMAAPVLIPQLELYAHSGGRIAEDVPGWHWLETAGVLAGVHPWMAGTFRTISIRSVSAGPSFHLALGGVMIVLAVFGWARRKNDLNNRALYSTGGWLVLAFLLIVLTPLQYILYLRAAGLGILAVAVLAGLGGETLLRARQREAGWSRVTWALAGLIAIGTTVLAHGMYPRFQEKVRVALMARAETDGYGGASRALRNFQADNFANEVTLRNPECVLNLVGLGLLAIAFSGCGPARGSAVRLGLAFAVSTVPLLTFATRFVVRSPVAAWSRLLEGGPLQQRIVEQLGPSGARLEDEASGDYTRVFPMEIAALHRLHVAHGYAALQPRNAFGIGKAAESAAARLGESGEVLRARHGRFQWTSNADREVQIAAESLNRLRITYPAGPDDVLVRLDTWYPGWTVNGTLVEPAGPEGIFSRIPVRAGQTETAWEYRPIWNRLSLACALAAAAATGILAWLSNRRRVRLSQNSPSSARHPRNA